MDAKNIIKDFVFREFCTDQDIESLADDDELIESGIINSLTMLNLLVFLEESFSILIPEDDLIRKNFTTIKNISDLVVQIISSN